MHFEIMMDKIRAYHHKLGYPKHSLKEDNPDFEAVRLEANRAVLALYAEIAELQESYPWKPWRDISYTEFDINNIATEVVDVMFFLSSIIEIFGLPPKYIIRRFEQKLAENYRRIEDGYNTQNKS